VVDLVDPRDVVKAAVDDDLVVGAEGQRGLHPGVSIVQYCTTTLAQYHDIIS
jgi:hypothetical protein